MRIFIQKFQTKVFATLKAHWMIELTNMNQRRFNLSLAQILERDDGLHPTDILRNWKAISGTPKISKKFFSESAGIRPTIS